MELAKKCEYCCKTYFSRRGMRDHMKTHKAEAQDVSHGLNEEVSEDRETIDSVPGESAIIGNVPGESAIIDSVIGGGATVDDAILENAIVYNFTIENVGIMEEVISDGIYSIGNVNLTSADMLPFIANM